MLKREGGVHTPPELEVESSPVSANGSTLFRFWIAELAISCIVSTSHNNRT